MLVSEIDATGAPLNPQSAVWFADRSAERWQHACTLASDADLVILDGDPFKGLWYNAVFHAHGWPDPAQMALLYRERIEAGRLAWPDLYVALDANETALARRRASDPTRRRRNFELHLALVAPLRAYFSALAERWPERVSSLDTTSLNPDAIVERFQQVLGSVVRRVETPGVGLVEELANWVGAQRWGGSN